MFPAQGRAASYDVKGTPPSPRVGASVRDTRTHRAGARHREEAVRWRASPSKSSPRTSSSRIWCAPDAPDRFFTRPRVPTRLARARTRLFQYSSGDPNCPPYELKIMRLQPPCRYPSCRRRAGSSSRRRGAVRIPQISPKCRSPEFSHPAHARDPSSPFATCAQKSLLATTSRRKTCRRVNDDDQIKSFPALVGEPTLNRP